MRVLSLLFLLVPGILWAELFVLDVSEIKPGHAYIIQDGQATLVPLIRPGGGVQPNPTNPPVQGLSQRIMVVARQHGLDPTAAKALSVIYSTVSEKVAAGKIKPDKALEAAKRATDAIAGRVGGDSLKKVREAIGGEFDLLVTSGQFGDKAKVAKALKDVSSGFDAYLDSSGLLDLDLDMLIMLIKLIIELISSFG